MIGYVVFALGLVALVGVTLSVRVIKQYERVVLFELGRVKDGARGPGLIFFVPFVDRVHRVSLRIITMPIQSQGIITKDNVSIDVFAVAYCRVEDLIRSVIAIENVESTVVFPAPPMSTVGRARSVPHPRDPGSRRACRHADPVGSHQARRGSVIGAPTNNRSSPKIGQSHALGGDRVRRQIPIWRSTNRRRLT